MYKILIIYKISYVCVYMYIYMCIYMYVHICMNLYSNKYILKGKRRMNNY